MGIQDRKRRERERRRQQIMVAAKRIFCEKGFHKATMEDIAREAELSSGTIYLYFKSKDELFSSLSIRILEYLYLRIKQVIDDKETRTSEQKIKALMDAMYDVYKFDPLMLISMFHLQSSEILKNLSPQLINDLNTLSCDSMRLLAGIFKDGIRIGDFNDTQPMVYTDIMWAMFSGLVLWDASKHIVNKGKTCLKDTLDIAFEIFINGIKRRDDITLHVS